MRRGPKPEPASVKLAKGNSGRRPIGAEAEVKDDAAAKAAVSPPAWLKKDGLVVWNRIAPRIMKLKLLSVADSETFARYCRNFARWLRMQETLDREGETYESESAHGKLKRAHPAFLIGDRLERQLLAAEANFGLNPAERQRIFAARAGAGAPGDLFDPRRPDDRDPPPGGDKPMAKPAIGLLN
ncbi:P27 family predicted phage terminase small subunit [Rhodoligotrophos appendicifer]|uniref:phage terminase small subunit P27 family n=1 Tax=Rhodoligotrophos appendicifer TaxID=987056 RepID=UPI001186406C|nr:phage terminase small subunit P27 family [Rhodoligotrophos appendicifer]